MGISSCHILCIESYLFLVPSSLIIVDISPEPKHITFFSWSFLHLSHSVNTCPVSLTTMQVEIEMQRQLFTKPIKFCHHFFCYVRIKSAHSESLASMESEWSSCSSRYPRVLMPGHCSRQPLSFITCFTAIRTEGLISHLYLIHESIHFPPSVVEPPFFQF